MTEEVCIRPQDEPCRILYLIDGLEGDGAERQLCELVKGVAKIPGFDARVGVLEHNESGHAWMLEEIGINIESFARRSRFDLTPIMRIVRYIRDQRIDLVHAYMSMGSEFGLIAARFCRVPVITSSIRNGMNRDWREAVRTFYQSHLADRAVANSQAGFDSRFRKMHSSFRVIYNGFDRERFRIGEDDKRRLVKQLKLPSATRLVCMAARMEVQKDHRTLLEAMAILLRSNPDVLLLLAGQGTLEAELKALALHLGISENVRFIGHRRDIEKTLSICDVSVLLTSTDIHLEGISNTIIESMAVGTPVVATRGGGTDEIFGEADGGSPPYEFGIKVDPYDPEQVAAALAYLLDDEAERCRIAHAGRELVLRRFDLERFVTENVSLYRELSDKAPMTGDAKETRVGSG